VDSIGGDFGKHRPGGVGKKVILTCGTEVPARERGKENTGASWASSWARPVTQSGEEAKAGHAYDAGLTLGKAGKENGSRLGQRTKCQGRKKKTFSFSFSKFSKEFQIGFEFLI
jgi:hypothetical protein